MMFSTASIVSVLAAAQVALAHIELVFPPGINSKYDPQTPEADIDYSMTSPLDASGSNYPCKGYNTPEAINRLNSVATLNAGDSFHINMTGSATHDGGSCQFSLSYDGGDSFAVIASIIGGCPLTEAYDITIPSDVPSKTKALFAWTWQNEVGNREEYMNCAVVDVKGGSSDLALPGVFRANTFADGGCQTVEGQDPNYPNPGKQIQYAGSLTASSPVTNLSPCSFDEDYTVTLNGDGTSSSSGGSGGSGSSSGSGGSGSSGSATGKPTSTTTKTTSTPAVAPSSSSSTPPAGNTGTSAPAPTTTGTGTTTPSTGSSGQQGSSYVKCTSDTTWSLCSASTGECTAMGNVAPGTKCTSDSAGISAMVATKKEKMVRKHKRGSRRH